MTMPMTSRGKRRPRPAIRPHAKACAARQNHTSNAQNARAHQAHHTCARERPKHARDVGASGRARVAAAADREPKSRSFGSTITANYSMAAPRAGVRHQWQPRDGCRPWKRGVARGACPAAATWSRVGRRSRPGARWRPAEARRQLGSVRGLRSPKRH